MSAVNGSGTGTASRRRLQRNSYTEGATMVKREKFGRTKRRRGERILRAQSSSRDEESCDETFLDGEDEEEIWDRLASSSSSSYHPHHHRDHQKQKRFQQTTTTTNWKADEILGVVVPRKARSGAIKRLQGSWISAREEQITSQSSSSPSTLSAAPATKISPSSAVPGRKRLRVIGSGKLRPPKASKTSTSLVQDELDVAEVLFGLTRQLQPAPKSEGEDVVGEIISESKPGDFSQSSSGVVGNSCVTSNQPPISVTAPKRKRMLKVDDESLASSAGLPSHQSSSVSCADNKLESFSPQREKKKESLDVQNVDVSSVLDSGIKEEIKGQESIKNATKIDQTVVHQLEAKNEVVFAVKEDSCSNFGSSIGEESTTKSLVEKDKAPEVKFAIDLMAPPPENCLGSQETDQKAINATSSVKIEMEMKDEALVERKVDKFIEEQSNSKCQKGKELTNRSKIDCERIDKDNIDGNEIHAPKQPKEEKPVQNASPSTPLILPECQGNFPFFGYAGQVPPVQVVLPPDASSGPSPILQTRLKRCATHCYIAQKIHSLQSLAKANSIWPAAAAVAAANTVPGYGDARPGSAVLGNSVEVNLSAKNPGSLKSNHEPSRTNVASLPTKEMPSVSNAVVEGIEKKQQPQSVTGPGMLTGPKFLFPINQQQAAASVAATITGSSKSAPPNGNSTPVSGPTCSVNLSFAGVAPNEAQYFTMVQNGCYPFPIPTNVGAVSEQYRGLMPAGAIPVINSPFYSSQVLHPSQIQQKQAMVSLPLPPYQVYQSKNNSIGLSSSAKHHQLSPQDPCSGTDKKERVSSNKAQNNPYSQKYSMQISDQNSTLFPTANPPVIGGSAGAQMDDPKRNQHQLHSHQKQADRVELSPPTAFAMPLISLNGVTQSGVLFQNLPESLRQQYSDKNIAAGSATSYAAQQKEGRSNKGKTEEDSRKSHSPSISGRTGSGSQHTLTFSRTDKSAVPSILDNNAMDNSSRSLSFQTNLSDSTTAPNNASATTTMNILTSQQMMQLPMHNQYPSSLGKIPSLNHGSVMYTEQLPATKFSQSLAGFSQTVVQGGNGSNRSVQSSHLKANARATTAPQISTASQSVKNNVIQQQGRAVQPPVPSQSNQNHQNLISFGANMTKAVPAALQHSLTTSSQPLVVINPPQNSGLKGSHITTTQESSCAKPLSTASVLSFPQQLSSPRISSISTQTSSSFLGNREPAALNSHTDADPTRNSAVKLQYQMLQQASEQSQKVQPSQAPKFFSDGFTKQGQPNAALAGASRFYQPCQPEQSQRQNSSSDGSGAVTETCKTLGNVSKGPPPPGLMNAVQFTVTSRPPATYPYTSTSTVSVKPTEQKSAVR